MTGYEAIIFLSGAFVIGVLFGVWITIITLGKYWSSIARESLKGWGNSLDVARELLEFSKEQQKELEAKGVRSLSVEDLL